MRRLILCVRTAEALVRLRGCAGSPEPSLFAYVISPLYIWATGLGSSVGIECPLLGREIPVRDSGLLVKNGTSCSSFGTQTYELELGLVDPVSECDWMWYHVKCLGILQWGSTINVSTGLAVATRHRRDMTEKLLKATLNQNIYTCIIWAHLHLPPTFLRWTYLDQLALYTDERQFIMWRCR